MLPRRLRLSRRTFPQNRKGLSIVGEYFSLVSGPSKTGGCAVVVSKKVAKSSVDRHLIKRRVSAVILPYCSSSRYLVVHAKTGSKDRPFSQITRELKDLLSRVPSN